MNTPAIELQAVEFSWKGQERLLNVERLTIERGERVFLKGPSGSGKSTLLGLIGGVLTPLSGTVSLLGTSCCRCSSPRHASGAWRLSPLPPKLCACWVTGTLHTQTNGNSLTKAAYTLDASRMELYKY